MEFQQNLDIDSFAFVINMLGEIWVHFISQGLKGGIKQLHMIGRYKTNKITDEITFLLVWPGIKTWVTHSVS